MKRNFKILTLALVFMLTGSLLFTACSGQSSNGQYNGGSAQADENKLSGKISLVGSTSVQPLAQELADEFNNIEPKLKIDIQGVGSTAGVKAAIDGTADIGMSSRELSTEEKGANLTETVIAIDGIAVIINPANGVSDLSKNDVVKIFTGEINNWKAVGGEDKEIIVVSREAGSGTRGAFEELLEIQKKEGDKTISLLIDNALIAEGNGAVLANVAGKTNAIGYMSLGMVDEAKVKKVKVDGVEASEETLKAGQYKISRPLLMLTKGEMKKEARAYLDYVLSEAGQKIVAEDYIAVN